MYKITVAVDPGVRGCGVAVFLDAALWSAWYCRNTVQKEKRGAAAVGMAQALQRDLSAYSWCSAWVEWPVQRNAQQNRVRRSDVSDLLACAAACAFVLSSQGQSLTTPLPEEWKGQTPKHIHTARMVGAECALRRLPRKKGFTPTVGGVLRQSELDRFCWETRNINHNIVDAAGIGLRAVGR